MSVGEDEDEDALVAVYVRALARAVEVMGTDGDGLLPTIPLEPQ
jgi:hypothetical protein